MKKLFLTFFFLSSIGYCQNSIEFNNGNSFQYGFSIKAKVEILCKRVDVSRKDCSNLNFRLALNAGIGSKWIYEGLYPTFNTEFQLYNGGFGSKRQKGEAHFTFDAIMAFTLTTGLNNNIEYDSPSVYRNVPFYYFADFAYPALQNPFTSSLSLGTNIIFSSDRETQRIGFLNLHPFDNLQISYYNDGTPFGKMGLGDGKDRYYTGGGVITYTGNTYNTINLIELSYHKFTGYTKNSFELANALDLSYVDYDDAVQHFYNKSQYRLTVANIDYNTGISISAHNSIMWDAQHFIHWIIYDAFHLVPYGSYYAIEPVGYYNYSVINLRK